MPVANETGKETGARDSRPAPSVSAVASCRPADRSTAEQGIRLAYAAAALPPPEHIIWCDGPLDLLHRLSAVSVADAPGPNVKADIADRVLAKTATLAEVFCKEAYCAAIEATTRDRAIAKAIDGSIATAADAQLGRFLGRARDLWRRLSGGDRMLPAESFKEIAIGCAEHAALALYAHMPAEAEGETEVRRLRGLSMLAASAGLVVPHARTCWICERPLRLQLDARCRLHCADGPALQYQDGFKVWAWMGVEVPAWAIEHPERISIAEIDCTLDPVLRRCLIDIMTPERLIASGAAKRLSRDETGTLWGITWQYRGVTIDKWAAVEVADGAFKHAVAVPADVRTAREAVAWTCGACRRAELRASA